MPSYGPNRAFQTGREWGELVSDIKAWVFDPALGTGATSTSQGSGRIQVARVPVPQRTSATKIVTRVVTAGATLTANQNLAAIYSSGGWLIPGSVTVDQSSAWTSVGVKEMVPASTASSGRPVEVDDVEGWVYVALLTVGTTIPLFGCAQTSAPFSNIGTNAPRLRHALDVATGLTAMPAQLTPGTMTAREAVWVGLA